MVNVIRSNWTTKEILQGHVHPGKPARVTAGSWVDDVSANKVPVLLCDACDYKWDEKKYGYNKQMIFPGQAWVQGQCDGCKKFNRLTLYMHEESLYFNRQWRLF